MLKWKDVLVKEFGGGLLWWSRWRCKCPDGDGGVLQVGDEWVVLSVEVDGCDSGGDGKGG